MLIDPLDVLTQRVRHYQLEIDALGYAVVRRLREGALPPDDAYWWARILGGMAHKLLSAKGNP